MPTVSQMATGRVSGAEHGIPADAVVVACYSRFDPQKDQKTLVEAFDLLAAEFPKLHLVLAGPVTVPSFSRGAWMNGSTRARSGRAMRRLEQLAFSGAALADAYDACDVFVLPSRHEPFGIVVLEAWSAGKPVVVSRVGGLQHLVSEERRALLCLRRRGGVRGSHTAPRRGRGPPRPAR